MRFDIDDGRKAMASFAFDRHLEQPSDAQIDFGIVFPLRGRMRGTTAISGRNESRADHQDMQAAGAICQTVLPSPTPPKPPTLCPACDLIESAETKIKRQRLFDNCMRAHGWEAAR